MKLFLYIFVTYLFICSTWSSIQSSEDKLVSFLENAEDRNQKPVKRAHNAFNIIRTYRENNDDKWRSRLDPVLNFVNARRSGKKKSKEDKSKSDSSSREMRNWKDDWREHWIIKKFEAINSSDRHPGDDVNMVAARPWGVPCGDPDQHDMPWGSCTLPMECDAEYRIYRGDFNCGRTQFVCCAIIVTNYDMYQGFDLSFEDSGLRSDSNEKKNAVNKKGSGEKSKKKRQKEKRQRKQARKRRKKQIRRLIRRIQKEIRRIINRQERNASQQRKRKTTQLKKFIKMLKAQYRHDRKAVQDVHEHEMIKIDEALMGRIKHISDMNQNFVKNETFREVVVNGTLNRQAARMLVEAYPELKSYINVNVKRRSGGGAPAQDYLDYDVEYGMLYY